MLYCGIAWIIFNIIFQKTEPDEDARDDLNEVERRDHMLESLLTILSSAAALGLGPPPGDMGKQFQTRKKSAGEHPGKIGIKRG